ncbi:MAG: toll/interleukin-1 receptor domain-containing protein [Planctomycetes bacterium]|nr:toll/interleukin-1 receptor domain-containing protein [Planctomycetota bacterium]
MAKKKPTRRRYQVFLSHATTDKWLAKTLCEKIEQTGAATFRDDRDIQGGNDIPDEIRQQITRSDEFVVLLTPDSIGRQWVQTEIGAAWLLQLRIVPIRCHVPVDHTPDIIKEKKSISLNEFDDYLKQLGARVRSDHG